MAELIWEFNDFMSRKFNTLALGLTPSGELHVGFLATLACALMYLKEHPEAQLIITNIENSLGANIAKYNYYSLRYQVLEGGRLFVPAQSSGRCSVTTRIHGSLTGLIWQLAQAFDNKTAIETKKITESKLSKDQQKLLKIKENKIFRIFGTHILVLSFMNVLKKNKSFVKSIVDMLVRLEFAQIVGSLCGIQNIKDKPFGPAIKIRRGGKEFVKQGKAHPIPIRLTCPDCHMLCSNWALVVTGCPVKDFPPVALVGICKNLPCPRAQLEHSDYGFKGHIIKNAFTDLHETEFHFMLDPMRDFYPPFLADCHVFGGDYFQLVYEQSGVPAIAKIRAMFEYMERQTGERKFLFGGPLVTMSGRKMSKSAQAFNLSDLPKITKAFLNIVEYLESKRGEIFPEGLKVEYSRIIKGL